MGPLYQMSEAELELIQKYILDMTNKGLIRPSKSPCGAPVLFARKKDGLLHLCVDYRRLNAVTEKNVYPLPLIYEMLNRVRNAKIFTALDLKDAYWLVQIKEGDEWKTAFRTRYGLFEYLVMPFGLTNAPSNFQSHVNRCFSDLLDKFVLIYLDDFLIYSDNLEDHEEHVSTVLKRIIESNLAANLKKCKFHQKEVEFLGYLISPNGVSMLQDRVKVVQEWKEPKDLTETQQFLGFCNFYRGFIPRYSELAAPLTELTKKDVKFCWGQTEQSSFDALKLAFKTADVVCHYSPGLPIVLETDASDFAISGVLSQEFPDGNHPIGFLSRKLRSAELNGLSPQDQQTPLLSERIFSLMSTLKSKI